MLIRSFWRVQGTFFQKGGGTPNPLRTCIGSDLIPGNEEKVCFFCKLLGSINKRFPGRRRQSRVHHFLFDLFIVYYTQYRRYLMTGKFAKKITWLFGLILAATIPAPADQAVIIMDADTGQVLHLENPKIAIETAFPTGSLIKPFSALFGLKENIISPSSTVHCRGKITVEVETFECWQPSGHGLLNFYKALAYSCNVYFYHYSQDFPAAGFLEFLRGFGFGQKTGIDMPNEDSGEIPASLTALEKAKLVTGSSRQLQITPIQAITAFAAIVNGGKLLEPWQKKGKPTIREDLNLAPQLPLLHRALQEAATYGTSQGYFQETGGFAKTGTAPWAEGFHTHGWFAGYLPLSHRRIVILVFIVDGTGAKDALPIGIEWAKKIRKQAQDQQPIEVSLFSLLKPKTLTVQARFCYLLIDGVGEEVRCRKAEIKFISPNDIKIRADDTDLGIYQTAAIKSSHANGFLNLKVNKLESRDYPGYLILRSNGDFLEIIDTVSLGEYLKGVIGNEMSPPLEALKCQAVLSRTYAWKNLKRHDSFDFCDTTHCQRYTGRTGNDAPAAGSNEPPLNKTLVRRAVEETAGQVLTYKGHLGDVYYHSTCGGATNDCNGVWADTGIPYLKSIDDRDRCSSSPHYRWQFEIEESRWFEILREITGGNPVDFRVVENGNGGWIKRIAVTLSNGQENIWRGEEFHILLGRRLGWNAVKSANFTLQKSDKKWVFSGKGLGHGVGLCQWGAMAMAEKGADFREILQVYFPGTGIDYQWIFNE